MEAYLSPKEMAAAIGVSESSLKRWADEGKIRVARTAGGHRRIARTEAIRFIRESHLDIVRPDILGLPDIRIAKQLARPSDLQELTEPLYQAMATGDLPHARGLILSAFLDTPDVAALLDGPIQAVMARLGELYQHSDEGIFIEHRATDMCLLILNQLRSIMRPPAAAAPVAVGGAPSGDPYRIPTLMASIVLTDVGFRTMNLGGEVPFDVISRAACRENARLLWLSATSEADPKWLKAGITQVADDVAPIGTSVVIGGRQTNPTYAKLRPNVHRCSFMTELAAYARGLLAASAG